MKKITLFTAISLFLIVGINLNAQVTLPFNAQIESSVLERGGGGNDSCALISATPMDDQGFNVWNRPFEDGTCCSALGPVSYHYYGPFTVSADGAYTFHSLQNGWDGYLFLYENDFVPTDPTMNYLDGNDDFGTSGNESQITANLVVDTYYYLVTTGFAAGDFGDFETTITGPGTVSCFDNMCAMPTDITLVEATDTTLKFSWTGSINVEDGYAWALFYPGEDPYMDEPVYSDFIEPGVTELLITDLPPDTSYVFYMFTICDMNTAEISEITSGVPASTETLGVRDNKALDFVLYPNPAVDIIYIDSQSEIKSIELYSISGQLLVKRELNAPIYNMNISDLASGVYLVKISGERGTGTYRLVKK